MQATYRRAPLLALAALGLASAHPAHAQTTVVGGSLFTTTSGIVQATYLGTSASYDDYLFLFSPANTLGQIFFNHGDPVGTVKSLGFFTAGTELVFRLHVNNTNTDFYSGTPSRNPDSNAHARVTYGYTPTQTLVEFEDLNGGPYNYNDLSFSFTNVQQTAPEPSPTAALGLGVIGLSALALRARKRKASDA